MMSWIQMVLALLAAALLAAAGLIGLLRRGVDPIRPLRELRERSLGRLLWLALFVVCAVHQGATKFTNGLSGASSPQHLLQNLPPTLDVGDGSGSIFPAYTNAVTNLTFTGIMDVPASNAVYLGVTWPSNAVLPFSLIDVFAKHDLVTNAWEVVGTAMVDTNLASAMIEVPYLSLPDGYRKSMFFRVGSYIDSDGDGLTDAFEHLVTKTDPQLPDSDLDLLDDGTEFAQGLDPNVADTDGDGLDDIDEAGSVRRLSDFEWYDLSGCTPSFGKEPGLWSYFGASLTLNFVSGVNLCGMDCQGAVMFDNGYVAISAPGDFNGWVFPEVPTPLAHAYNSGSILVAPYWKGALMAQYGNTNSFIRAGHLAAEGVTVFEFHDVRDGYSSANGMTFQVIVPDGTGNVVRVSYLSSDIWLDGGGAVVGVHNRRRVTPSGYYNITWNFDRLGSILPGTTVEYRLGLGTDPAAADPDGDGLSDADEIRNHGTDPWKADTDGDGLDDADEISFGVSPVAPDTDGDGMDDGWERFHRFDPLEGLDAAMDADGDGLSNLEEYVLATNPHLADTDGDGLNDGAEIELGLNPMARDADLDSDHDGLSDAEEMGLGTDPFQPDTDGDGMDDAWEVRCRAEGFNPVSDNRAAVNPRMAPDGDLDGDGLTNAEECRWGTNPGSTDTDGDGVSDGDEIAQSSDPCDASDDGEPGSRVKVDFCFGDDSGSHSEKYLLEVVRADGAMAPVRRLNQNYGECEVQTIALVPDVAYEVRLFHAGTNGEGEGYPDYDYTLQLSNPPPNLTVEDPHGLFRSNDDASYYFSGFGKVAVLRLESAPPDEPPPEGPGSGDPTDGPSSDDPVPPTPSLDISFSAPAVIFEDGYRNLPSGNWQPRRSTSSVLTIRASGGLRDATLNLSNMSMFKLVDEDGLLIELDSSVTIPAGQVYSRTYTCFGAMPSVSASDKVRVSGTLVAEGADSPVQTAAELTVVKVALEAVYVAPENPCQDRHVYGVGEQVKFTVTPALADIRATTRRGDPRGASENMVDYGTLAGEEDVPMNVQRFYTCPISSSYPADVRIVWGTVEYMPQIEIIEPQEIVTANARWGENGVDRFYDGNRKCWPYGEVGESTLVTVNYVSPMFVSFQGIAVSELPCEDEEIVTGCFTTGHYRTHTRAAGAGTAYGIKTGNYWFTDGAGSRFAESNWIPDSTLVWRIPIGWHRRSKRFDDYGVLSPDYEISNDARSRPLIIGGREDAYMQNRHIDDSGVFRTEKFGFWISRSRWCHVMLGRVGETGSTLQWIHLGD